MESCVSNIRINILSHVSVALAIKTFSPIRPLRPLSFANTFTIFSPVTAAVNRQGNDACTCNDMENSQQQRRLEQGVADHSSIRPRYTEMAKK